MVEDQEQREYLLDEDLGENGGVLRVRKPEKLEAWVQSEQEFWSWLNGDDVRVVGQTAKIASHQINLLNQLAQYASQIKVGNDPVGNLKQVRNILQTQYKPGRLLHSGTPEAGFINRLREDVGLVEAAAALGWCTNQQLDLNDFRQFRGAVSLVVFLEGATPKTMPAVRGSLKKLAAQFQERYAEDVKVSDTLRDALQGLVEDHTKLKERGNADMAKAVKLAREQAERQRTVARQRLDEYEALYNTKLALDAPVKYWREKRAKHRWLAVVFFIGFVGYLSAAGFGAATLLPGTELTNLAYWKVASLGVVGLALAAIGIVVALARVLLRLAMSQLHLGNDADERVTMVNTYLALRQGGHADEGHIQIVLERLFAPATDGIVKEDLGPVTVADAVKSALTRKG